LAGWFLGFEPRVAFTRPRGATGFRHCGEAAVPEKKCGPCPDFGVTTWKLRKNHVKTSVRVTEKCNVGTIFCRSGGLSCRDRL
jgi:hypothetical protein